MRETTTAVESATVPRLRVVLSRLARTLRRIDAGAGAGAGGGLTPTRTAVLLNVVHHGPIRLADVAEQEGLNPTMLSRAVTTLATAGLLSRTADPGDRRSAWLQATAAGRTLAAEMRAQRTEAVEAGLAQLCGSDRRAIEAALPALERLARGLGHGSGPIPMGRGAGHTRSGPTTEPDAR